jgi:hypothetical protein
VNAPSPTPPGWIGPNPPPANDPRTTTVLAVAGVLLTVVVAVSLVAVVLLTEAPRQVAAAPPPPTVTLIAAGSSTDGPFMPSVVVADAPTGGFEATLATELPYATQRGVRVADGTKPGLYGGIKQVPACDPVAAATHLKNHAESGSAWATAIGIVPEQIPFYLNTLTPVLLTADTWVTAHRFDAGQAQPFQAVLQAGNAVMVDPAGVPRLLCGGGNPLTPPADRRLADYQQSGTAWSGYTPANVVAINYTVPGASSVPMTEFDVIDPTTNTTLHRQVCASIELGNAAPSVPLPDPFVMNRAPPS